MKNINKYLRVLTPIIVLVVFFLVLQIWLYGNRFDETILNENNIYDHIQELTSEKYNGKLVGSTGNEKAMEYVEDFFAEEGIEPAGVDGTYYQSFSTVVPQFDTAPEFAIKSPSGEVLKEFELYRDYKIVSSLNGGGIDFHGDLVFVGSNLFRVDPVLLEDRIVVIESNGITMDKVNYVIQSNAKGILCRYTPYSVGLRNNLVLEKSINLAGKTGESILVGYISTDTFKYFSRAIESEDAEEMDFCQGIVQNVSLKVNIDFPVVNTANILAKIPGRSKNGRTLLITAGIDGVGEGTNGKYFPGAVNNVSGIATLLETARVIKAQDNLPYENIVFIGFNGQEQFAGSDYYLDNPLYPLEKTTIIHLENIGEATREGTKVISDEINSTILKSSVVNYANDAGLMCQRFWPTYSTISKFADKKISAIMISDSIFLTNSYEDAIDGIDKATLRNSALVLLNYIKRGVYKDVGFDYLSILDKLIIFIFLLGLAFNYVVTKMYKTNTNLGKCSIEKIYYSNITIVIRKIYYYVTPIVFSLFFLAFLANINHDANIRTINNETVTNFSFYLTFKNSIYYIKSLFDFSNINTPASAALAEVIIKSSIKTLKLMLSTLLLATVMGILRGMFEGYKSKRGSMRSFATLTIFSIPDVLIVLVGMLLYIAVSQNFPNVKDVVKLDEFVLPLVTLSILPIVYVSRVTFITIEEEIKKEYIRNAKAKGFSRIKVISQELFPAIIFKIIDTLPGIMTMIISNMIVVEYLFNYNGVVYYLLYYFRRQDINGFIAMSLVLGAIFIIFTWGIKFAAKLVNPLKKEDKNAKV